MPHSNKGIRGSLKRTRFQQGSIAIEKRKTGQDVWVYRWRETGSGGQRIKRKKVIGTKAQFPSRASALRGVEGLTLEINIESLETSSTPLTINQLIEHYRRTELGESNSKTARTKEVYEHQLTSFIAPRWGMGRLRDVKPIAVEMWLGQLPGAPGSKAKTKGVSCPPGHRNPIVKPTLSFPPQPMDACLDTLVCPESPDALADLIYSHGDDDMAVAA